jgi:hypothetical protein
MTATETLREECPIKDTSLVHVVVGKFDKQQHQRHLQRRGEDEDRPAPPTFSDDHLILINWQTNDSISGTTNNSEGRILFDSLWDTHPFPQWFASWQLRPATSEMYDPQLATTFVLITFGEVSFPWP